MKFTQKNLYNELEASQGIDLDQCDFGVVRMDRQGAVLNYNQYEAELAQIMPSEAVGKIFFTQIAPCTNNFLVAAKYLESPEPRDETIDYIFTYKIKPVQVKLRLLVEPDKEHQYLLVQKQS